ncbi:MAG: prepilin peptidase [Pseudomonadota bacterium]
MGWSASSGPGLADPSAVSAGSAPALWEARHWGLIPALAVLPFFAASGLSGAQAWVPWLAALMASYDLAERRIPNPLNALAALLGLGWALAGGGLGGLGQALLGGLTGFGLLAVFFFLGAVGAGDVKALGALCTFLAPWGAVQLFFYTVLVGGLLALGRLLLARRHLASGTDLAAWRLLAQGLEMPYGLAIAGGALVLLLTGGLS